jgi:hypothetical protein
MELYYLLMTKAFSSKQNGTYRSEDIDVISMHANCKKIFSFFRFLSAAGARQNIDVKFCAFSEIYFQLVLVLGGLVDLRH